MRHRLISLLMLGLAAVGCAAQATDPAVRALEAQVGEAINAPGITVVHFWAPWCPNCKAELDSGGWGKFIAANPDVNLIFITIWPGPHDDGRAMLAGYGLGPQKNFRLLVHPNRSLRDADKMREFMGMPVTWIPATWVFREGKLRYALNYGEVRFPMLQQLVDDASDYWAR
ncbi:MAG: hypothetical protein WD941_05075 [Opitutus sp.]